jgi:hypothetical protein
VKEQEKGEGKAAAEHSGPASACYSPCSWQHLAKVAPPPPLRLACARCEKKERFLHPRQQQISLASFHFGSVNIQERTFSSGAVKSLRTHAQGPANMFAACKIHFCWCQLTVAFTPGHQRRTEKKNTQLAVLGLFTNSWNGGCAC